MEIELNNIHKKSTKKNEEEERNGCIKTRKIKVVHIYTSRDLSKVLVNPESLF